MAVCEIDEYFEKNKEGGKRSILEKKNQLQPVSMSIYT